MYYSQLTLTATDIIFILSVTVFLPILHCTHCLFLSLWSSQPWPVWLRQWWTKWYDSTTTTTSPSKGMSPSGMTSVLSFATLTSSCVVLSPLGPPHPGPRPALCHDHNLRCFIFTFAIIFSGWQLCMILYIYVNSSKNPSTAWYCLPSI